MAVAIDFSTIPEMFWRLSGRFAGEHRPLFLHKIDDTYRGITYSDVRSRVEMFAHGLATLGIQKGDRVAIIAENRPEWAISDLAIVSLGAIDVPIYPTMTAKQIEFIFKDARVKMAIVSNQFQLNKVMRVYPEVDTLEKIILIAEKGPIPEPDTLSFSAVTELGKAHRKEQPDLLASSIASIRPDDLLTIIYTSGTTGNPKGVMLTHDNLVSNIKGAAELVDFGPSDIMLSFLPLSHSFERMAGYYTGMACGVTIAYAESVETVRDNMLEVRPTIITTVPRLFERIHSRVMKQIDASSPLKKKIFHWAIRVGRTYAEAKKQSRAGFGLRLRHGIADRLVYGKLRERTGGRMRFFVSGGAALGREFGEFFEAVGLTILEGYGLTESSPVISVNRLGDYKFGSVGRPIPGVEVTIAADGEILARGPNIMKGYWNNPEATSQAVDREGWLHTGDIGFLDPEGFIHITDRKKHLFVSSGGKNIAPQPIESLFLSSRYIEQFMLIGDRRMFLTALIVPDFEALREYADARNIRYASNADLARDPLVNELMDKEISKMQRDLANYERVRRFTLLEKQFSIEDGELTPTQKIRRKVIEERYSSIIESMYEGIS
jgi:long-chain acyl-CoA synthetase